MKKWGSGGVSWGGVSCGGELGGVSITDDPFGVSERSHLPV